MSRIRAISAGAGAETEHFGATVHSVFARACNLALDDGGLLALLGAELGNAPGAVSLETSTGFAFDRVFEIGERVACRAGVMRTERSGIAIRLARAHPWRVEVDGLAADPGRPAVSAAWRSTRRHLERRLGASGTARSGVPPGRVRALWSAIRAVDIHRATRAARALIGCGAGLTPAGDDLLVGIFAGLRANAHGIGERERLRDELGHAVGRAANATTPISAAYLLHATHGCFAEPLARLAHVIAIGAPEETVERAAGAALGVGATSGCDGVGGLLLGLGAWRRPTAARRGARRG